MVVNSIDFGMNVAEATNAPRFHHQWLPDELRVEKGFSPDTLKLLEQKGQKVALKEAMGSTQSIMVEWMANCMARLTRVRWMI